MNITLKNPSTDGLEKTYLAQSYNFGTTSIEVKNNQEFSANQRIQIGESGLASTEIVTSGTPNADGTTIPISATLFPHEADAPVYLLEFDQAYFYRSTDGIDGPYTALPDCPINLDVTSEDLSTNYDDTSAEIGYYYETAVYNSLTGVLSATSDPIPAITGWSRKQVGYLIETFYASIADVNEENMSRDEIIGYLNEVNDDLQMQVVKPYNFLLTRQAFGRTAGANSLDYPTDDAGNSLMWKFDHMDYNYVDNTTSPVTNDTFTVPVVDLVYFRNRYTNNTGQLATVQGVTIGLGSGGSLTVGQYYYYVVTALYGQNGESAGSLEVFAAPVAGDQEIVLAWEATANATGYNVYKGLSSGGELYLTTLSSTQLTFTDAGSIPTGTGTPPPNTQSDVVQEMALNEAEQQFDYYPASATNSNAVWYLYYYTYMTEFTSEGDTIQTPTPKIYLHYLKMQYYLKKAATSDSYLTVSAKHEQYYLRELQRYKSQDRRDVGTPRSFHNAGWALKSTNRNL